MKSTGKNTMSWKKIHIDDSALQDQGLILFEECTDYTLINNKSTQQGQKRINDVTAKKQPKKKKQKVETESEIAVSTSTISPSNSGNTENISDSTELQESSLGSVWSTFGVAQPIIKALDELGFETPTQIQALTLPAAILGRRDIVGAAETGSGKTLAFGLPILTGILNNDERNATEDKKLFALILTPTRELAMQIKNHLMAVAKYTDIKIALVVGGMAAVKQERILKAGPEIVVATPGRLWELIQQGNAHLSQIDRINYLVIDETDRMLERDHFEEIHSLLERLNEDDTARKSRQNFVFSATLTLIHELPKYLTNKLKKRDLKMTPEQKLATIIKTLGVTNFKTVDLSQGTGTSQTLTECKISCSIDEKDYYVYYFLQRHPGRTLIFCNSIGCVRRLTHLLNVLKCKAMPLHAQMQQRQRFKNLERFTADAEGILVATDVAARGLDIPKVEHVLHYQTPRTSESYVHRSGRTARASNQGITVLLIEPSEVQNYIKLCRNLKKEGDLPPFPVLDDCMKAVKARVKLARDVDQLDLQVRKSTTESSWLEKAAEDMDIIVDFPVGKAHENEDVATNKKLASRKRKQLDTLLEKSIFSRDFNGKFPLIYGQGGATPLDGVGPVNALDVMKEALESQRKRHTVKIFKRKKTNKK